VSRLGLLLTFPALLLAQNSVEFTGRYWMPQMGARIRVEAGGLGADIDARSDLGMPDTNFPKVDFTWQHGRSRVRFDYTPIDYTGDQTVTRTVVFRGREYTAGTRVVSELEVRHLQLSWAYQFVNLHEGRFRIGPMVEAEGFLMRGSLAAPNLPTPFSQTEDLKAGIPTVGLAMDIQPHRAVDIFAQVAGMQAGSYGYFVGSDSGVKVRAWKHLLLTAGYRTFNMHIESTPDFARIRIRGPFVGAGFRF
jgi:hypothetical protein